MQNTFKIAKSEEANYWQVFVHHFSAASVPGMAETDS